MANQEDIVGVSPGAVVGSAPAAAVLHDDEPEAQMLPPKIQSKMQVSTFLAGFSFTSLITVLTQDGYWNVSGGEYACSVIATTLLAWATAMFIAAVYMFDQLAMPTRFTTGSPASCGPRAVGAA